MITTKAIIALVIFLVTVFFLLWRPKGINEAVPPAVGACLVYFFGIVNVDDINYVLGTVTGASITIISTMIMSIVLESMGFFRWVAFNLVAKCNGSGTLLYWNVILLCFLMTMFFNNDGSIVITTPIIIEIVKVLELAPRQKFAYLLSGALVATAASAPIGVSNLANLIALKIVNLDLVTYAKIMFVPSMLGLFTISLLLFIYFRKDIPKHLPLFSRACIKLYEKNVNKPNRPPHKKPGLPHQQKPVLSLPDVSHAHPIDWTMFKVYMTIIIVVRACFFILSNYGVPIEGIAVIGALLIVLIRWYSQGIGIIDVLKKTPWHIFVFAFGMYVVVYGLHNAKFTALLINWIKEPVCAHLYNAVFIMGILLTAMSNLLNNLPSVMLGTITITQMGLGQDYLQVAYLANILGSDIGSLILPNGTLASLIWLYVLKNNGIPVSWKEYISATIRVIPIGLLVSLLSLYLWVLLLS
jgi:arsenical pump membrane protein